MTIPWPDNADKELTRTASVLVDNEELAKIRSTKTILRPIIAHWDGQFGKFLLDPNPTPSTSFRQQTLEGVTFNPSERRILDVVHLIVKKTGRNGEIYKEKAESRMVVDACRGLEEWILDLGPAIDW